MNNVFINKKLSTSWETLRWTPPISFRTWIRPSPRSASLLSDTARRQHCPTATPRPTNRSPVHLSHPLSLSFSSSTRVCVQLLKCVVLVAGHSSALEEELRADVSGKVSAELRTPGARSGWGGKGGSMLCTSAGARCCPGSARPLEWKQAVAVHATFSGRRVSGCLPPGGLIRRRASQYDDLVGVPKALLPTSHSSTILDNWWESIRYAADSFSDIYLVCNAEKFQVRFGFIISYITI